MRLAKWAMTGAGSALVLALMAGCGGGKGDGYGQGPCGLPGGCGHGGGEGGPNATAITTQPQGASVITGDTATFSVAASGTDLAYQWLRNGQPIDGATSASYTTAPVSHVDHASQYAVVVSGKHGTVASEAATLTLSLSADQQIFEQGLASADELAHRVRWNLNYSGPQTSGINFAYSEHGGLSASPLTAGPQQVTQSAPLNLTASLSIANLNAFGTSRPVRVLKDGAVRVVPGIQETRRYTYVGSRIRSESLATDGSVGHSTLLSGYAKVGLSGTLAGTPPEMAQWFNSFWSNAAILTPGALWQDGSAYTRFTATNEGDRYDVYDCAAVTLDANVTPCYSGTTLQAALSSGMASPSDGRTYFLADGVSTTVAGVPVWVANLPRPISATLTTTVQYRIYFELNGNVYTGALTRDGTVIGGTYFVANPGAPAVEDRLVFFPYQVRLNKPAHDSLRNAMAL